MEQAARDIPIRDSVPVGAPAPATPALAASSVVAMPVAMAFTSGLGADEQSKEKHFVDLAPLEGRVGPASAHASASPVEMAQRPQMHTHLIAQIAEAMRGNPDKPIEITLSPQELGRVRMMVSTAEAGVSVSIMAERPETLELLRRNIESLAAEFRDMGYADPQFSFESQGQEGQGDSQAQEGTERGARPTEATVFGDKTNTAIARISLDGVARTGLDIRL